jgi:hypothetical protein
VPVDQSGSIVSIAVVEARSSQQAMLLGRSETKFAACEMPVICGRCGAVSCARANETSLPHNHAIQLLKTAILNPGKAEFNL